MAWLQLVSALTVLNFLFCSRATAISTEELDGVLTLLRAQGHMLFANAISTSDMLFDILSVHSLTLLAPTDPTVFALDMTNTPPLYISTLGLHALPIRLSWSQIRLLSNGSLLPTLSLSRQLRVVQRQQGLNTLVVDGGDGGGGVEVVMPGLYYSRDVAVHALDGILAFRSKIPTTNSDNNTINNKTTLLFPRVDNNGTLSLPSTLPRIPVFNNTSNRSVLPRCPSVNHARPIHSLVYPPSQSPAPAPASEREMGEVIASGDVCVVG